MSAQDDSPLRGIENRFRDLSVDVRQERLVRYIVHHIKRGRHVKDIVNDPYIVAHTDESLREHILGHPEILRVLEEQIRLQFAGYGDSVESSEGSGGEQNATERTSDGELPDL